MIRRTRHALAAMILAASALAASALAAFGAAAVPVPRTPLYADEGSYRVYAFDRLLGTEKFEFIPDGDSLVVYANVDQIIPTPEGERHLIKTMGASLDGLDFGLRLYSSGQEIGDLKFKRGIIVYDTTMTIYLEARDAGSGTTYARPTGRFFVVDAQIFTLFDIMLRGLHGKMLERSLPIVVLQAHADTVTEIRVVPGATETVMADGRSVKAQRVSFRDDKSEVIAWVDPTGRMVRLEQPAAGLRVERVKDAPAAPAPKSTTGATRPKPAKSPPPASPTGSK